MNAVTLILLLVAASSLVVAARWAWRGHRAQTVPKRLLQGPSAQGVVVDTAPYSETIEFTAGAGTPVTGRPAWNENTPADRQGETVTVYYDREDPSLFIAPQGEGDFHVGSVRTSYIMAGSMAMGAVLMVLMALLLA